MLFRYLAHATEQHDKFRSVLETVFKADNISIAYLKNFAQILSMSISHVERFSERVNVKHKQTRLLKRALNEIIDDAESGIHEFSDFSDRPRSGNYSPMNMDFLASSDDESARKKQKPRPHEEYNDDMNAFSDNSHQNKYRTGKEPNVVREAMRTAKEDLRNAPRDIFQHTMQGPEHVSALQPRMMNGVPTFDTACEPIYVPRRAPAPASLPINNPTPTTTAPATKVHHAETLSENTVILPTDSG